MDTVPRITSLISQASALYKLHFNAFLLQSNINLTSEMCAVLAILWKSDGKRQQELADTLFKNKGGITKIINNLEKRELVVRVPHAIDGRNKIIKLTKKGYEIRKSVVPVVSTLLSKATNQIDKQKLEITKQVLMSIINQLR